MKYLLTFALGLLLVVTAAAQNMLTVSGTLLDDKSEPVVGASVVVKGTTIGVSTDAQGSYSIQAPSNGTLVFSFIGMETEEKAVNGRARIDVGMVNIAEQIDEVVVVGYGAIRKSDITGSVGSVKMAETIKSMPVAKVTDALQGRLAGVSVVSASGDPNAGATIRVRGVNSISGDGGPLVVIDGFIGGNLNSINPADIQSVEVLKDASATAVYGSRAASGVILVTTKQGDKGAAKITFNGYVNIKTPGKLPEQLSAADNARLQNAYVAERHGGNTLNGAIPTFTDEQIADLEASGGYDYLGATFQDVALEQMYELSISGRGEATSYLISGSLNDNDGVIRNSSAMRANYRLKLDTDVKKWLKVGANLWGTYSENQGPSFGQYQNVLNRALMFPRFLPARNDQGGYNDLSREPNPMRKVNEVRKDGYTYDSWLQGYADFTILPGLTFRALGGVTLRNTNSQTANTKESYQAQPSRDGQTSATASSSNTLSWINSNILSYVKEFNENHRVNATLVFEQSSGETYEHSGTAGNLYDESIAYNNLDMATGESVLTSNRVRSTMMSALARVNYVLFDRYMVTASYRYDGSSKLAKGKQWYGFPSAAVAWDIKKESFMRDVEVMSQAKLRFGYGVTGNQAVPDYSAFSRYTFIKSTTSTGTVGSVALEEESNPNLKWETSTQYNVGVDFGFLHNRITASIDLYDKLSEDLILKVKKATLSGFSYYRENAASIRNRGVEFTLGADPLSFDKVRWHTDLTFTVNESVLERIDGTAKTMELGTSYENAAYLYIVGERIGTMWGNTSEGIWKTSDLANAPVGTVPGSYRYKNLDDKPVIDNKDMEVIGCGQPKFSWGWNNTVSGYGFDLSLFFIGFHGFDIFNNNEWLGITDERVAPNPKWLNRWTPTNEDTDIPGFIANNNDKSISSRKVEKGDFIRLKNLTLGYTLPGTLLQRVGIANLRAYVSFQNLLTFTGYSGLDPEVTLKNPLTPGADWGYYPNGRSYIIGLSFTF